MQTATRSIVFYALICLPISWSSQFRQHHSYRNLLPHGVCLNHSNHKTSDSSRFRSFDEEPDEAYYDYDEPSTTTTERKPVYSCCPGYKEMNGSVPSSSGYPQCKPICNNCRNGNCIIPNGCYCLIGYRKDTNNDCIAQCPAGCPGGVCVTPNHCKPVSAFRPDSCNITDCVNGCNVSVGLCLCVGGFEKINATVCEPKCEKPCGHGYCAEPNRCNCDIGYQFDANAKQCVPICRNGCIGGECLEPDKCVCGDGYRLETSSGDAHICVSISDSCKPCPNISCDPNNATGSTTSSIGYCRCGPGYGFINSTCTPLCLNVTCVNGRCSAPEKCSCLKNYRPLTGNRTDICTPICDISCMKHGNCIDKNNCQCDPGYISLPSRPMECLPQCSPACRSGEICILPPDICGCRIGYQWENGDCKPRCSKPCINGYCILPEKCVCDFGFFANNGSCLPTKPTTTISSVVHQPISSVVHQPISSVGHQAISTVRTSLTSGSPVVFCSVTLNDADVHHFNQFSLNIDYNPLTSKHWTLQVGPDCNTTCDYSHNNEAVDTETTAKCRLIFRDTHEGKLECSLSVLKGIELTCKPVLYHYYKEVILVTSSSINVKSMDDLITKDKNKCTICYDKFAGYYPITIQGVEINLSIENCSSLHYETYTQYQRGERFKIYAYIMITLIVILLVASFTCARCCWKRAMTYCIRRVWSKNSRCIGFTINQKSWEKYFTENDDGDFADRRFSDLNR